MVMKSHKCLVQETPCVTRFSYSSVHVWRLHNQLRTVRLPVVPWKLVRHLVEGCMQAWQWNIFLAVGSGRFYSPFWANREVTVHWEDRFPFWTFKTPDPQSQDNGSPNRIIWSLRSLSQIRILSSTVTAGHAILWKSMGAWICIYTYAKNSKQIGETVTGCKCRNVRIAERKKRLQRMVSISTQSQLQDVLHFTWFGAQIK